LRAFPFTLQDEDVLSFSANADAIVAKASLDVSSSARSVSVTLYPDDMLAIQQHAASEAAEASDAAKFKAAAAADRHAATTAAIIVINRLSAVVLRRFSASAADAVPVNTLSADTTAFELSGKEPQCDARADPDAALRDISHEAAARAAARAAAENAAKDTASASSAVSIANPVRVQPKPRPLLTSASPSRSLHDVSKLSAVSAISSAIPAPETSQAADASVASTESSSAAAKSPAAASSSGGELETLHDILSRLDLLQLEVSFLQNVKSPPLVQYCASRRRCSPRSRLCLPYAQQPQQL
jgi:hypothetical protein